MANLIQQKQIEWNLYDFHTEVIKGNVEGHRIQEMSGYNEALSKTLQIIAPGGIYKMPQDDTALEIVSNDTNDTVAGSGAEQVKVEGINKLGIEISEIVDLNGTTPVQIINQFFRIFNAQLETSGTYATHTIESHQSEITIRESGDGDDWAYIQTHGGKGIGKSQIGGYTIPVNKTGYIISYFASVETNKYMNMFLFTRENANQTIAPYSPMLIKKEFHGIQGTNPLMTTAPLLVLPEFTDVGCIAAIDAGHAAAAVNLQILIVDNDE